LFFYIFATNTRHPSPLIDKIPVPNPGYILARTSRDQKEIFFQKIARFLMGICLMLKDNKKKGEKT
jgi:hypothetical protein